MPSLWETSCWQRPLTESYLRGFMDTDTLPLPELIELAAALAAAEGNTRVLDLCRKSLAAIDHLERCYLLTEHRPAS